MSNNRPSRPSRGRREAETVGKLQTLHDLPREIEQGDVAPVYALCGADSYLLDKLLDECLRALLPEGGSGSLDLHLFDGDVTTLEEVTAAASTVPMLATRLVVVLRNPTFLEARRQVSMVDQMRRASSERDAGRSHRAARHLAKALGIDGTEPDPDRIRAQVAAVRDRIASEAPECLPLLDAAVELLRDADLGASDGEPAGVDALLEWAKSGAAETAVVLIHAPGPASARLAALKRIAAVGKVADVDSLKEQGRRHRHPVEVFIEKQLDGLDHTIRADAMRALRERANDDLGRLADELEKLAAFVADRTTIELGDVEAVVSEDADASVFDLTDAVGERNLARALEALDSLIRHGEPPIRIHALLTRQVRLMLQAHLLQDSGMVSELSRQTSYWAFLGGVHGTWPDAAADRLPTNASVNLLKQKPYPIYAALRHATGFSREELYGAYDALLACDEALKSGPALDVFVLHEVVANVVGPSRGAQRHATVGGPPS